MCVSLISYLFIIIYLRIVRIVPRFVELILFAVLFMTPFILSYSTKHLGPSSIMYMNLLILQFLFAFILLKTKVFNYVMAGIVGGTVLTMIIGP